MEPATHLQHLAEEGRLLAAAAAAGEGSEPVPGCPGWTLDDLVRHTGVVHVWARDALLRGGEPPARGQEELLDTVAPTEHAALPGWYAEQLAALLDTLSTLDPATAVWQLWDDPAGPAFWARRQAHETAIHRYDAEGAVGARTSYDTALAADGVHEVLLMVAERKRRFVRTPPVTFTVEVTDTGERWTVEVGPGSRTLRAGGDGDVQVSGVASDLHAFLWNRPPVGSPVLTGETALWDLWREGARII